MQLMTIETFNSIWSLSFHYVYPCIQGRYIVFVLDVCLSVCPKSCPLHISKTAWMIFMKLGSHVQGNVQNPCLNLTGSRLKSCLKVKGLRLYKSLHISKTAWRIFMKLGSHVHLIKAMRRTHVSTIPVQGQGHAWRSKVWGFILCPLHISKTVWKVFMNLGSHVHLIKAMCRTHVSKIPGQGQGHAWRSKVWGFISCLLHISKRSWRIFMKCYSCSKRCVIVNHLLSCPLCTRSG